MSGRKQTQEIDEKCGGKQTATTINDEDKRRQQPGKNNMLFFEIFTPSSEQLQAHTKIYE